MVKFTPRIALLFILFISVPMVLGGVQAGAFDDPIIYDWLNNSTDDEASHVGNYSIDAPQAYFSSGLEKTESVEDKLNESNDLSEIYRVYDETYEEIPIEPVYEKWNSNNIYDYEDRPYIPEFRKGDTKSTDGGYSFDSGTLLKDGWTGIYSIQPSTYTHYTREDGQDVTRQVVGDEAKILAIVNADQQSIPETDITGNGVGATRKEYSLDEVTKTSKVYIQGTGDCPGRCLVGTATVSQSVAEATIDIDEHADPGEQFEIIVESTVTTTLDVDEDNQIEVREEVECEDDENNNDGDGETTTTTTTNNDDDGGDDEPCYEWVLEWEDDDEYTTDGSSITMTDSQTVTYPKGVNNEDVQEEIQYERAIYPNGTTEIYLNTEELTGTVTETGAWRKIQVGDDYIASNWRAWSARNMSWDNMYEDGDSDDALESHTRPLAIHTAPITQSVSSTDGITVTRSPSEFILMDLFNIRGNVRNPSRDMVTSVYDSPHLRTHHTCHNSTPPLSDDERENANCGWWISGSGNTLETIDEEPYLELTRTGSWATFSEIRFRADGGGQATETLEMYGMVPDNPAEIEPDREITVNESELYAEIIDNNNGEGEDRSWIKVRFTLVDAGDNSRINTNERGSEHITVKNSSVTTEDGEEVYVREDYQTNASGQVTVKIYNPKQNGIDAKYDARDWTIVDNGQQVYTNASLERDVTIPAFSMAKYIEYLIGFGGVLYIILTITVRFMNILQMNTTVQKEFEKMFPNDMKRLVLFTVLLYFVLSLL